MGKPHGMVRSTRVLKMELSRRCPRVLHAYDSRVHACMHACAYLDARHTSAHASALVTLSCATALSDLPRWSSMQRSKLCCHPSLHTVPSKVVVTEAAVAAVAVVKIIVVVAEVAVAVADVAGVGAAGVVVAVSNPADHWKDVHSPAVAVASLYCTHWRAHSSVVLATGPENANAAREGRNTARLCCLNPLSAPSTVVVVVVGVVAVAIDSVAGERVVNTATVTFADASVSGARSDATPTFRAVLTAATDTEDAQTQARHTTRPEKPWPRRLACTCVVMLLEAWRQEGLGTRTTAQASYSRQPQTKRTSFRGLSKPWQLPRQLK